MTFQIITLFPDIFDGVFDASMMRKAKDMGVLKVEMINLRDHGIGPRKKVDDIPYGGGDGMVLKPEPIYSAIQQAKEKSPDAKVLLMTPRGDSWVQSKAFEFAADKDAEYIIVCPRYEGYDERIIDIVDYQISIGDYVLTGGEIPAMILVDSITRLLPNVLGGETSAELESFSVGNKKEHPHYTRPADFEGKVVPDVLLRGNHKDIEEWRDENSIYL